MIKMNKYLIVAFIFCAVPAVASAETVVRAGESVSIGNEQVVENDFYAAAGNISMSGEIRQDMYSVGGSVTVNGPVGVDLTAISGTVQIHAPVGDDVRIVGGEMVIADRVGGDVFVIGGLLKVLSSASIGGDVFFYGGEGDISGSVGGSIMGAAESLRIDGSVGGNIDVSAGKGLTLGDRASVGGDVRYQSPRELTRSQNALIDGEIVRNESKAKEKNDWVSEFPLVSLFVSLFAALSAYLFFREKLQLLVAGIYNSPVRHGLYGFCVLFLTPIAIVLLFLTILGTLLGVVGLFAWMLLISAAYLLTSVIVGALSFALFNKMPVVSLQSVILGAVLLHLLFFVPVVGPFAVFVCFVLTVGGLTYGLYKAVR